MTAPVPGAPPRVYSSMEEFFDERLAILFARGDRFNWCVQWQEHPEAATVVQALWDTWEAAQHQVPDGMAVWMRDFAYPLLFDRLTVSDGTFSGCTWRGAKHSPDMVPLPRV